MEIFGRNAKGLDDKCGEYRKEKTPLLLGFRLER